MKENTPTIVFLSTFKWDSHLLHREHMLAKAFQRKGCDVYFVEKSYSTRALMSFPGPVVGERDGITTVEIFSFPYLRGIFGFIYQLNDYLLRLGLSKLVEHSSGKKYFIASTPLWAKAIHNVKKSDDTLIYDMSDDLVKFTKNGFEEKNFLLYEERMIRFCDAGCITTEALRSKFPKAKPVFIAQNGVDIETLERSKPAIESDGSKPLIGFIGGIYEWVDLSLFEGAAVAYPQYQFLLVGPTSQSNMINRLKMLSNITYVGEVEWQKVGDYFASLDLGLIPFVSESEYPRLKTVDSNKVYQYAFFGYPIVSTTFVQVQKLDNILTVSKDKEDFIKNIGMMLESDSAAKKNERKRFAIDNSWDSRTDEIMRALENLPKTGKTC